MNIRKISLCTVCMGRIHHLSHTLPKNIEDNISYPNIEFVLLDYNSKDGMENWVKENFIHLIQAGKMSYFKTFDPVNFNMSHSKNMVSRLASGDVVCLIDADNYTGKNYAAYINACYNKNEQIFVSPIGTKKMGGTKDVLGRVCLKKEDFHEVGGFDEFMVNYGFDDYDLTNRLVLLGRQRHFLNKKKFLHAITHDDTERVINQGTHNSIERVLITHLTPSESKVYFLFNTGIYNEGNIVDNIAAQTSNPKSLLQNKPVKYFFSLATADWAVGKWAESGSSILLRNENNRITYLKNKEGENNQLYDEKGRQVIDVTNDLQAVNELMIFHSTIRNRNRMESNMAKKVIKVNHHGYGSGIVYRNFDYQTTIHLK